MKNILIIDDQALLRRLVFDALTRSYPQACVTQAENGRQAIELMSSNRYDLVICDVVMPQVDGFEVLRWLREESSQTEVPCVMLTGETRADDIVNGWRLGATSYVTKPFNVDTLIEAVEAYLTEAAA
ncbi:MAG: response regulator transcription factor [Vulcanimicrobiota bacterium]